MTAKEFINQIDEKQGKIWSESTDEIADVLIRFAKFHVEKALKAASESKSLHTAYTYDGLDYKERSLCKESVLNAYPLKNII